MNNKKLIAALCITGILLAASPGHSQQEMSAAGIFAKESESVVLICAFKNNWNSKKANIGTGFIVSNNGLIVTNYHVINTKGKIVVKLKSGKQYAAETLIFDEKIDVAVIKIKGASPKPVTLGNSDNISIGERVIAIGNPLGLEYTISDGLISANRVGGDGVRLFQTSVPVSQGSSGGPIFNYMGEVIGVAVSSKAEGQNLNFAIPINEVRPLLASAGYHESAKIAPHHSAPGTEGHYTVVQKDTLYSIAKKFNTTVEDIMVLNKLPDSGIFAGQKLRVPGRRNKR